MSHWNANGPRDIGECRALKGMGPARCLCHITSFTRGQNGQTGKREYVQVLRLLETFEMDHVHGAVRQALDLDAIGCDAVKHLVLCRVERRPPKLDLDVYPFLPAAQVETTKAASYNALMSEIAP